VSEALAPVAELARLDQLAALTHPVRRRILGELLDPASPAEVARRLGIPAQLANYHIRALRQAELVEEVGTRLHRNLVEHQFRAVARAFVLSTALPLSDRQRAQLQGDVALQALVQAGDTIRHDAVQLLENPDAAAHASAVSEVDLELANETDCAALVAALLAAVRAAVEPYRQRRSGGSRYRAHVVIYPAAEP